MRSVDLGMVIHGRHDPAVEAAARPLCEHAAESWRARDPETLLPLEPAGARADLKKDLPDAPHRLIFYPPHNHQYAQR